MRTGKTVQVLNGLLLVFIGMACCLGTGALTLLRPGASLDLFGTSINLGTRVAGDFSCGWPLLALMSIGFVEAGLWLGRQGWATKNVDVASTGDIWSQVARFQGMRYLITGTTALIATLAMLLVIGISLLWLGLSRQLALSTPFMIVVIVVGGYLVLRLPLTLIWRRWGGGLSKRLYRKIGTYELSADGVTIDPGIPAPVGANPPRTNFRFYVGFAELDEIHAFSSYPEAQTFIQYSVGPNLDLATRQPQDMARFIKGEIARPTAYTRLSSVGKLILLRGPGLFYLLNFDADDVSDLLQAFQRFKATNTD